MVRPILGYLNIDGNDDLHRKGLFAKKPVKRITEKPLVDHTGQS